MHRQAKLRLFEKYLFVVVSTNMRLDIRGVVMTLEIEWWLRRHPVSYRPDDREFISDAQFSVDGSYVKSI
jgi:hypothetical protein